MTKLNPYCYSGGNMYCSPYLFCEQGDRSSERLKALSKVTQQRLRLKSRSNPGLLFSDLMFFPPHHI